MHDDIYDHDHPESFEIGEDEIVTDIEGLEMFSLKSVGIDIGSSTSHWIVSHITLQDRPILRPEARAGALPAEKVGMGIDQRFGMADGLITIPPPENLWGLSTEFMMKRILILAIPLILTIAACNPLPQQPRPR